jgi:hypothetical protein
MKFLHVLNQSTLSNAAKQHMLALAAAEEKGDHPKNRAGSTFFA